MSRGIQAVRLDTCCWCRECGATQEPCHHLDAYLKSQQREQAERALVAPPRIERNHGLSESDMAYNRKFQERRKKWSP